MIVNNISWNSAEKKLFSEKKHSFKKDVIKNRNQIFKACLKEKKTDSNCPFSQKEYNQNDGIIVVRHFSVFQIDEVQFKSRRNFKQKKSALCQFEKCGVKENRIRVK